VLEIAAGVAITYYSCAYDSVGLELIFEGANDLYTAISTGFTRKFITKSFLVNKGIRIICTTIKAAS